MKPHVTVEICVDSVASAISAERGGAQRIELCGSLHEGGVTPSAGLIELVRSKASIQLHVMIRPRGGDFCYSADEFEAMRRDILVARNLGADGVVFGILEAGGNVDVERTRQLVELARPLAVTFHRAVDMSLDIFRAMEDVCATGAERLLTSGGEQTAVEAISVIAGMVTAARGGIAIMACGGIDHRNAAAVIEATGVREIHAGLRSPVASTTVHRNPSLSLAPVGLGPNGEGEYRRFVVLEENVRKLCATASSARIQP